MTPEDYAFTRQWWDKLLADDARMIRWLQKLWATEHAGYDDNYQAAKRWSGGNIGVMNIFMKTGDDELRHAALLETVLKGRGVWPITETPPESTYWEDMDKGVVSLETCAAVFYMGEHLAAERFQVLLDHEGTPADIKGFLVSALPDERHHARVFRKLTTPAALADMQARHDAAVARIKGKT
ncbi:hypothetical protein MARCHEWKA_03920 [Brevundimonas phage vB_BpoS-Marchewka]|uniref:Rubrerythrin diiron-binding domain-containing protein n=1 Tax=Brevundimonas phage vB_BpoS-Marchewka TaxID=2948604 RepID=A0A9E7N5U3_9CAUD|nr:hypothetical protein MARCHEWKA_03920 [Brevundimonas phage vB_BpoS-Marchewka]